MNKNPGLLQKSGTRVGLGKQRGAAIRQKIKKDRRYRYTFAFLQNNLPQIFLFFLFLVFFLFFIYDSNVIIVQWWAREVAIGKVGSLR